MLPDILTQSELAQMRELIAQADNIVVCCHVSPDGDAIGSSLAMSRYLEGLDKAVRVVVPDQYPDFLAWLPGTERILRYDKHPDEVAALLSAAGLLFCLDFNGPGRTEDMAGALTATTCPRIMIDHHPQPDLPCDITISHPEMSSTAELVFRIVWQDGRFFPNETMSATKDAEDQPSPARTSLLKQFATCVYCGMMTDTGGFTFNSNEPGIFYIISQLLTTGIDKDKIYRNVYHTFSENRLRLTGRILADRMIVMADQHAAIITISREDMQHYRFIKGDSEGLVNMPLQIRGMRLSISLREDTEKPNRIHVSLRSVDDFPCNRLSAQFFGGGGHLNAAGGRLTMSLQEAVEHTRRAITEFVKTVSN